MAFVDLSTFNINSSDFNLILDPYQAKLINLLSLNKNQLKFLPSYGLDALSWIRSGLQYNVLGFITYLKNEASKFNIFVTDIRYKIEKDGGLFLEVDIKQPRDTVTINYYLG